MTTPHTPDPEAHGEAFSLESMRCAQQRSWMAVRRIAEAMSATLSSSATMRGCAPEHPCVCDKL
ncbi:MAG: hypothetical protein QM674_13285 [Burkholderiaceae bacterium]